MGIGCILSPLVQEMCNTGASTRFVPSVNHEASEVSETSEAHYRSRSCQLRRLFLVMSSRGAMMTTLPNVITRSDDDYTSTTVASGCWQSCRAGVPPGPQEPTEPASRVRPDPTCFPSVPQNPGP